MALTQAACSHINNSETIGKHGEVVKKTLYKCISKGLMHVAAWYHGTLQTKVHEIRLASP